MTATTDAALYPTIERLADLSRTTVGYQKPDLEREAVECYRECAALRAERDALLKVVAAADDVDRAIALIPGDLDGYLQAMDEPIATYRSTRAALKEGK